MEALSRAIVGIADFVCGYPLFIALIGGGLFLFFHSGMVSIRRLPAALRALRESRSSDTGKGISSAQALVSVIAATVGMGNIAGVAIAIAMGGPGAVFWMWVSAIVGMSTKYHEGVLAVKYRAYTQDRRPLGGPMYVIERALGPRWKVMAMTFAIAGMAGTLCIMNANQLTEALAVSSEKAGFLIDSQLSRFIIGLIVASIVGLVVLGGIRRIARVATVMVPFMVGAYFLMVLYIIATNFYALPTVIYDIFSHAFNLEAGFGALAGIAIIGARRAALVNDAGVGTASIMHGSSSNDNPVREGLVAMLGPAIDSGFVCTLTAFAILLAAPGFSPDGLVGLELALQAFGTAIPGGEYLLTAIVTCFAISSMFTYSFYGTRCAAYLFGEGRSRWYTWFFILTLVLFAVIPLSAAVGLCDLFYALMAFPTMISLFMLRRKVKEETDRYFVSKDKTSLSYADT